MYKYMYNVRITRKVVVSMKPQFPLSVTRHFCYRATFADPRDTVHIDSDDFKTVYQCAREHLRSTVGDTRTCEYQIVGTNFEFGYDTWYEVKPNYFYTEWTCIRKIGHLSVSKLSEWYTDLEGDSDNDFVRADYTERRN